MTTAEIQNEVEDEGVAIAIIGMAGRFPGASSIEQYWENLRDGVESVSFFSDEELARAGVDPSLLRNPNYVKASAVLDEVDLFDAPFFGLTPREAETMDPQQRLFLECAWEAIENAGYDSERYKGLIGVYAGMSMNTYWMNLYANANIARTVSRFQIGILNDKDHLPTRVSYKLNLKGPSINVQTACSTSLVAVHLACQSLLNGECDMALAGGVSITFPQRIGYMYEEGGINSPDGHCRAFDAKARGTVGGNGVGVVMLKRLSDALADGDTVHAVIKGSAINNDGSMKVGYTAPSVEGQAKVIAEALAVAGVQPETVSYIEAHGTGTALGDPIEVGALTQVFRAGTDKKQFCAIGSVKTNIGHLDAAAGVAGLIKVALALKHRQLPPSLHFEQPNPKIDFAGSPFYVNSTLSDWPRGATPLRAGVSSFGIGGTNAHVVLEEAPQSEPSGPSRRYQLLALSARTSAALDRAASNLADHLKRNPEVDLADVAFTLLTGRRVLAHRRAIVCATADEAVQLLASSEAKRAASGAVEQEGRPIVFTFPGQGAQHVAMGAEAYEREESFRRHVDECSEMLKPLLGFDLRNVIYPSSRNAEEAASRLKETVAAQPSLFVIEYALARLWMKWGIEPRAMIGHSIGEYVAACLAGVFSLEDALALVARRGQLMQRLEPGAMLAVELAEDEARKLLGERLSVAAVNGPSRSVISGPIPSVDELQRRIAEQGIACRRLHTSHAFHSEMMEPILGEFAEHVKRVALRPPKIAYLSNLSGTWITAGEATDPAYWVRHLRETVRFGDGLAELMRDEKAILLEVGPGQTLTTLARQRKSSSQTVASSLPPANAKRPDDERLLKTLALLWVEGAEVDWAGFYEGQSRRRVPLPTYPFERQRYFVEPTRSAEQPPPAAKASEAVTRGEIDRAPVGAVYARAYEEPEGGAPLEEPIDEPVYYEPDNVFDDEQLQRIIERQLQVMSEQLFIIQSSRAGDWIDQPPQAIEISSVDMGSETAEGSY